MKTGRRPRLDPAALQAMVQRALAEDVGPGDCTTLRVVPRTLRGRGTIRAKERLVLAGLPLTRLVFHRVDPSLRFIPMAREGACLRRGEPVARITGRAGSILTAERTALNFLQHLSGIATYTADCVAKVAGRCTVRDTRKTTPGLRQLEKYAVRIGGGENHRMGLHDGILIKHNHWRVAGGVAAAIRSARGRFHGRTSLPIQVEVSTLRDLREAIRAGADAVLLDNFSFGRLRRALAASRGKIFVEVSGGIHLENVESYAKLKPDTVSLGALTHSSRWRDLSLFLELLR